MVISAKPKGSSMPRTLIEQALKDFILETISEHFSSLGQTSRPRPQAQEAQRVIGVRFRPQRVTRRRRSGPKGRVTDPSTDKRLKANRQKAGNA